ncbi:response regulator transcription factor [Achromobacter xylosoxidans]
MTRILLADDHQVVILGVRNVLEGVARYQIVGEALSATELIRKARELTPDIIITDYNMPSEDGYGDGLALVQYLRRNSLGCES